MPYAKRTGMRKRSYARRPNRKNYTKKGLTKTEKSQVKTIAKRAVNTMVESKYFDVVTVPPTFPSVAWQSAGVNSEIGMWGFTTGVRRSADNSQTYKWGVNNVSGTQTSMTSLKMNSVFRSNASPNSRRQYALEGLSCRPAYNEVQWLFQRPQSNVVTDSFQGVPYQIRMLRLKPRALKASFQVIDPNVDCFLNALNEPFGPASVEPNTTTKVMTLQEFHLAKANSRRYNVIQDTTFSMLPSSVQTVVFDPVAGTGNTADQVTNPSLSGVKILKTKHNMGKEFHYLDPDTSTGGGGSQEPSTGFEPEFILFLVAAVGGVPAGTLTDNITISARPVSTFKDA